MSWLYEIAGRSQLALMWLVAVAIGAVIYFFPIARLLESLGGIAGAVIQTLFCGVVCCRPKSRSSFASFAFVLGVLWEGGTR